VQVILVHVWPTIWHVSFISLDLGKNVTVYARNASVVQSINTLHKNSKYLVDVTLSKNLAAVESLDAELFQNNSVIIMAIPTQYSRYQFDSSEKY
jgi:glycerol-3-phosphate dehydrogenase